jgi:UrcA family protein
MSATTLLAGFVAATSLVAATPGWSAPDPDRISIKVKVADLNLDTEPGARAALARIRNAAGLICGPSPSAAELQRRLVYAACLRRTVGEAVATANQPVLTAVAGSYGQKTVLAAR